MSFGLHLLEARLPEIQNAVQDTDYSRWERTPSRHSGTKSRASRKGEDITRRRPVSAIRVKSPEKTPLKCSGKSPGSSCSSLCQHSKQVVRKPAQKAPKRKVNNAAVLKIQITALETSIKDCRQHLMHLAKENIRLKEEITSQETSVHTNVSDLLEKYQRFRGTMAIIKKKHQEDVCEVTKSFNDLQAATTEDLENLSLECKKLEREVQLKGEEIKKLYTYKEKEYPEKILKIGKLQRDITTLEEDYSDEIEEICSVMNVEEKKYQDMATAEHFDLNMLTAKKAVNGVDQNTMKLAIQNTLMKKELLLHQNEVAVLEYEIEELTSNIRSLTTERKRRMQRRIATSYEEKCLPETDLVLNIPRQESLPI